MIMSEMQNKLATWALEDKERKFDRLLRLIADRSWLQEAARITLASRGARTAGVDGVDKMLRIMSDGAEAMTLIGFDLIEGAPAA